MMVTFFGNALFHLWPEFRDLSLSWISRLGLGVCFGMVGYLFFLGSMGVPLGLGALGKVLVIFLSVLLGGTLLIC